MSDEKINLILQGVNEIKDMLLVDPEPTDTSPVNMIDGVEPGLHDLDHFGSYRSRLVDAFWENVANSSDPVDALVLKSKYRPVRAIISEFAEDWSVISQISFANDKAQARLEGIDHSYTWYIHQGDLKPEPNPHQKRYSTFVYGTYVTREQDFYGSTREPWVERQTPTFWEFHPDRKGYDEISFLIYVREWYARERLRYTQKPGPDFSPRPPSEG